jgi:hypothetical protein
VELDPLACGPVRASTVGHAVSDIGCRSRLFVTLESVLQAYVAKTTRTLGSVRTESPETHQDSLECLLLRVSRYEATCIQAFKAARRWRKACRCWRSETHAFRGERERKEFRHSSKAEQKRAAASKLPKPRSDVT